MFVRKKWFLAAFGLFLLYAFSIYIYLFHGADTSIPDSLKGTSVDPMTFMDSKTLENSETYSKIRNFFFFISTPLEWLFFGMVLVSGLSKRLDRWGRDSWKRQFMQTGAYVFWLSLLMFVVFLPLSYLRYKISLSYGISTQVFSSWMKDNLIEFWVDYTMTAIVVIVLYWLIRKSPKRWWLFGWLLSIPFTIFVMFIQPVVIDPLYNEFYPLQDKELEEKILALAAKAEIPTDHVYEVNMSEKTNSLNAYVTGVGANSRIVLWDTTLSSLDDDEILFIMAHEMNHYVEKHIYLGIAGYLLLTLVGLWLTDKWMKRAIRKRGELYQLESMQEISSLPLFLLITSILLFAANPITNYVSRVQETRADQYALKMTDNPEAAVTSFQKLSESGLSQMNPPFLVKLFRNSHPSMLERIQLVKEYEKMQDK